MQHTGGRWIVGLVGLVIVICGVVLVMEGLTRKFEKYLQHGRDEPGHAANRRVSRRRRLVRPRIVFALAGVFVDHGRSHCRPGKAGGLDVAFASLTNAPAGPWLLVAVAIGLVMFGIYGFAEAKWRRT